ncbi:MAG: tRNA pseudouridine(13) synthase TruD [Conexivisphaera sp.]
MNEDPVRRAGTLSGLDAQLGMLVYSTSVRGMGGRVKDRCDDFMVSEVLAARPSAGRLPAFVVVKVDRNTIDVAEELGAAAGCRIRFWGLKDKRSISAQFMQCAGVSGGRPRGNIRGDGWIARYVGLWEELEPRHFAGNAFSIRMRGIEHRVYDDSFHQVADVLQSGGIANFFGYQRFGAVNQNHIAGGCIVRRDLGGSQSDGCPKRDELRSIPRRIRRLMVNAYQSYLFNASLSRVISEEGGLPRRSAIVHRVTVHPFPRALDEPIAGNASIEGTVPSAPVPGYAYRSRGDSYSRALDEIMREEGVTPRDFYVDDMPEVSEEGYWRPAVVLGRISARIGEREDIVLTMLLQRGSYATVVLREIMKPSDPVSSGLTR